MIETIWVDAFYPKTWPYLQQLGLLIIPKMIKLAFTYSSNTVTPESYQIESKPCEFLEGEQAVFFMYRML
jgi:hypothetical protein